MKPRSWTMDEIDSLKTLYLSGYTNREIGGYMKRTEASVFTKLRKLGISSDPTYHTKHMEATRRIIAQEKMKRIQARSWERQKRNCAETREVSMEQ